VKHGGKGGVKTGGGGRERWENVGPSGRKGIEKKRRSTKGDGRVGEVERARSENGDRD